LQTARNPDLVKTAFLGFCNFANVQESGFGKNRVPGVLDFANVQESGFGQNRVPGVLDFAKGEESGFGQNRVPGVLEFANYTHSNFSNMLLFFQCSSDLDGFLITPLGLGHVEENLFPKYFFVDKDLKNFVSFKAYLNIVGDTFSCNWFERL
jgi:hypothetical protein